MTESDNNIYQILLPEDDRVVFLEAVAAVAAAERASAVAFDEEAVANGDARALQFDPVTVGAVAVMALKFTATAIAGHVICRAFDKMIAERVVKSEIVVIDSQGREYRVKKAEALSLLRRKLQTVPKA
jgi:hypothetical protein